MTSEPRPDTDRCVPENALGGLCRRQLDSVPPSVVLFLTGRRRQQTEAVRKYRQLEEPIIHDNQS